MKYIKTHESFNVNYEPTNEVFGLALIAGAGLALFAPNIYREVKQFWSKHVIGEKYKETGNVEKAICKFDKKNISPSVSSLTSGERESGEVEIILKEYKDNYILFAMIILSFLIMASVVIIVKLIKKNK